MTDQGNFRSTAVSVQTTEFTRNEMRATSFLIEAIASSDEAAVRKLLDAGQDPNMSTDWYKYACVPPLAYALQLRQFDIARTLIKYGAGFGPSDDGVSSAMSAAIAFGGDEGVKLLLDAGHPITRGALMLAVEALARAKTK
jgi:ankyrin repeat protein